MLSTTTGVRVATEGQYSYSFSSLLVELRISSRSVRQSVAKCDWCVAQFPLTAIREIKLLRKLRHPNIVQLKDIVSDHARVYARHGGGHSRYEYSH